MSKKSLFERLGLVEGVAASEYDMPATTDENIDAPFGPDIEQSAPVQAEVPEGDTIDIQAVYDANDMDPADSVTVYKVKDMLDSLPAEMPNKTKKATLKSLMTTLGYDPVAIQHDAEQRIDILNAAANQKATNLQDEINLNSQKIEEAKIEIEQMTTRNNEAVQAINSIIDTVTAERNNILGILEFVKDEPAGKEVAQ